MDDLKEATIIMEPNTVGSPIEKAIKSSIIIHRQFFLIIENIHAIN
jgi:hypothetical protein